MIFAIFHNNQLAVKGIRFHDYNPNISTSNQIKIYTQMI